MFPFAAAGEPTLCFKNVQGVKVSRLQLTLPDEGKKMGKIVYQNGHGTIEVKRAKETQLQKYSDRPSYTETVWVELPEKVGNGKYVMRSQGALIDYFVFEKRDGKKTKYTEDRDVDAISEMPCGWKQK